MLQLIAEIKQTKDGYLAIYERQLNHSKESVWAMLTDNEKLGKWFEELRVGELRDGGFMKFEMEGMDESLEITELEMFSVLEFDWFGDRIRFELHPKENSCLLILKEKINLITDQTKKDLAGWHVCLDVIKTLLDGKTIHREDEWKKWYVEYEREINKLTEN